MRFRLRSLLIAIAIGPPILAGLVLPFVRWMKAPSLVSEAQRPTSRQAAVIPLNDLTSAELLPFLRALLGMPENEFSMRDGSLRIVADERGRRIILSGTPVMVERAQEIAKLVNVQDNAGCSSSLVADLPLFEVYAVNNADPELTLNVIATLLAGAPDVRLSLDRKTGTLAVLARPSVHKTVQAVVSELRRNSSRVENASQRN